MDCEHLTVLGGDGIITVIFFLFFLLRAAPVAYASFQVRGRIGAAAAGLCHSQSNARSELCLQPTLQLTTVPDP